MRDETPLERAPTESGMTDLGASVVAISLHQDLKSACVVWRSSWSTHAHPSRPASVLIYTVIVLVFFWSGLFRGARLVLHVE